MIANRFGYGALNTNLDKIDNLKNLNTMTDKKQEQCAIPVLAAGTVNLAVT